MSKLAVKALKWGKTLLVGEKQLVGDKAVRIHDGLLGKFVKHPRMAAVGGIAGYHYATGESLPEMAKGAWRELMVSEENKDENLAVGTARTLVDSTFGEGTSDKLVDKAQQVIESASDTISRAADGASQMAGRGAQMAGNIGGGLSSQLGNLLGGGQGGGMFSGIGSLVRGVMSHGSLLSVAALIPLAYMFFGNHGLMGKLAGLVLAPVIFNSMNLGSILDFSSPKAAPAISAQETGQLLSDNFESIVREQEGETVRRSRS